MYHTSLAAASDPIRAPRICDRLREAAGRAGVLVGAAIASEALADASYRDAVSRHFSVLQPENALKWAALRPSREVFDFSHADVILDTARANGQLVRGHVLAWHAYNPAWLRRSAFEPAELSRLAHEHIDTVVGRYADDIFAWDVVNEVVDETCRDGIRASMWYDRPGIGWAGHGARYADEMFRWARAAAPNARLFYNDDPSVTPERSGAIARAVGEWLDRGVPIDGLGLQLHLDLTTDRSRLCDAIAELATLGLELHITELDVALPIRSDGEARERGDLDRQATICYEVVRACLALPCCTLIQMWGVDDGHSWIPAFSRGALGAPLLLDRAFRPKPAYDALVAVLDIADAERRLSGDAT